MKGSSTPDDQALPQGVTDEYIISVTVGKREPLNDTIYLVPYNPKWPAMFSRLAGKVREVLVERVLLLEHVGSTAVPGLSAKPIIDMILAVSDSTDEESYVPPLREEGFVLRVREPDWFEHRMFKTPDIDGNLHVFSGGCEQIVRMVAFRDWIREHEDDRRLYEEAKRELAARTWRHVQNYADAKSEVIHEITARALESVNRGD